MYPELENHIANSICDEENKSVGLAVSGGGDSLALLLAATIWARKSKIEILAATVDHGLRSNSGKEALYVKEICANLSSKHFILPWEKKQKIKNLQDCARLARINLLTDWAKREKITTVLLGHSADDQAETIFMNFVRGSGLEGLSGMPVEFKNSGVVFKRPFLSVKRDRLRQFLVDHDLKWIEDPSNFDEKFQRVKVRNILPKLEYLGLTSDKIISTGERMSIASSFIRLTSAAQINHCLTINRWGEVQLDGSKFLGMEREIQLRILSAIIGAFSGKKYRPRYKSVKLLLEKILAQSLKKGITIGGSKVSVIKKNHILFQREVSAIPEVADLKDLGIFKKNFDGEKCLEENKFLWDNRWIISVKSADFLEDQKVGRVKNKTILKNVRESINGMAYYTAAALPAIFSKGEIIAMPGLIRSDSIEFRLVHSQESFVKRLEKGQ